MPRIPTLISLGLAVSTATAHAPELQTQNANHIFNAIHSSMRQWGSSLNHNGMSYFLATVPEGTQLYHGTSIPDRINGTEWLAFEPEHASVFARPRRGPPPGDRGPQHHRGDEEGWHPPQVLDEQSSDRLSHDGRPPHYGSPQDIDASEAWNPRNGPKQGLRRRQLDEDEDEEERPLTHTAGQRERHQELVDQTHKERPSVNVWIKGEKVQPDEEAHGYLHTYRPKRDLRLLYIDGQSGAKSSKGTLDSQDLVLLHDTPPPSEGDHHHGPPPPPPFTTQDEPKKRRPGGPMNEAFRAEHLCARAEKEWGGRIDGFLRMELGFEIILCNFERDLDVARITQVKETPREGPPGAGGRDDRERFSYYQAVASRFDGIGAERVQLNYDDFVTLFAFDETLYFESATNLPRVRNETDLIRPVQKAIWEMVWRDHKPSSASVNYQSLTDMVISRYADRIELLASGDLPSLSTLQAEIDRALRPFIDYGARDRNAEIRRCATQYFPKLPSNLAGTSILNVTTTLCSALTKASEQKLYTDALRTVRELKSWLGWTTWKRCRGCGYDEVCFVPIWPMGGEKEMETPKCMANLSEVSRGYWGGFGGRDHKEQKKGRWF